MSTQEPSSANSSAPERLPNGKLTWQRSGKVAWLTLTNPPANGYSYEMMRDLDEAILRARFDVEIEVIVIAGAGEKFFCAGADISMLHGVTQQFKYAFCLHANETLRRLEETPKLAIAAIGGHCVGGGLEIALACDLRIARRASGKCGLPEVSLGVLPGTGGTQRLARNVGSARAIELMASGRLMEYEEALSLGIVQQIQDSPDDASFNAAVLAYAQSFTSPAKAALSVGHIKRAVAGGADLPLDAGLALERELQARLFASEDAREGIAAYVEKRKPQFRGR
ncbi:MAG: enoyl-CoA hydratase/isomerase family protein [Planctomycetota bacterium]